jgi:fatty acid desaturase
VLYSLALPFVLLALRVRGWRYTLCSLSGRPRWIEAGLLVLNLLLQLAPLLALGAWWAGLLLGTQLVAGVYLGLVFAPHHKGMPIWAAGQRLSYVQRQVLTARNVRSHPLNDMLFGGLNYQIEHHLFPTMPRSRLRQARAIVRPFCLAHGLPYEDVPALVSYRRVYAELARLGSVAL